MPGPDVSGPALATRWDVLLASFVIGVDRATGVFSGSEPSPGHRMVCVWTSTEVAEQALHVESWELRPITMRDLLRIVPHGIGVVVDPEHPTGRTLSAAYVAGLRRYVDAFPVGSAVRLAGWEDMPSGVRDALVQLVTGGDVAQLHAFTYTLDDSPRLGCLAHVEAPGVDPVVVRASLDEVLAEADQPSAPGLAGVVVLPWREVPDEVRAALGPSHMIGRQRPSRLRWR